MNILITSASRKVSLIKSFQHALSTTVGGEVVAVDANPLSPSLYLSDRGEVCPLSDSGGFLNYLLDLCGRYNISVIIPTRDGELSFFARHKMTFMDKNVIVIVPSLETVDICGNKLKFYAFCELHGFHYPRIFGENNLPNAIDLPVFVKPVVGQGAQNASIIRSLEDLKSIPSPDNIIVQEYIDAPEYTVDMFFDFDGNIINAVPRERISVVSGESYATKTVEQSSIIDASVQLGQELQLIGHNTIQCFYKNEKVVFIEVNPRFGGAAHLGIEAGLRSPEYIIKLANGQSVCPCLGEYARDLIMLRYTDDIFMELSSIMTGRP